MSAMIFQIQLLFKKCSKELLSNLIISLKGINFFIGVRNNEWMNHNLCKASSIFTIRFPTIKGVEIASEMDKCCHKKTSNNDIRKYRNGELCRITIIRSSRK
jgi:hypothetical protein